MNSICTKVPIRRPLLQAVAVLGITAGLLVGMQPTWAGTAPPGGTSGATCIRDAADFDQGMICTANDVRIGRYENVGGPTECFDGQQVTVTLRAEVESGPEKYDVGIWLDENGGNAQDRGNTCYRDYLNPVSGDNSDVMLADGDGPYYNGEISDTADICGDVPSSSAWGVPADIKPCSEGGGSCVYSIYDFTATFQCQDADNDGDADVGTCTSWEVGVSPQSGSGDDGTCGDGLYKGVATNGGPELETVPSQSSKCNCGQVTIGGLTVLKIGFLEVIKDLKPDGFVYTDDSFDLQIDGTTLADDVRDGGTTGEDRPVSAGTSTIPGANHTVGEVAGTETDLNNYLTSIECKDQGGAGDVVANSSNSGPLDVTVNPDDDIVCTITNSLKLGMVQVIKKQSGVLAAGFTFQIRQGADGSNSGDILATGVSDDTGFTDFDAFKLLPGETYQLCEVAMMPGWSNTIDGFTPNGEVPEGGDNSSECMDFTADVNQTVTFEVNNFPPPGGDARTIGFWKNWTSCDGHGNQDPVLDETLTLAGGTILLGDFEVTNCYDAVDLLDKRDIAESDAVRDGKKKAGDAAYGLAAQLLAAQLNVVANASDCTGSIDTTIAAANNLLEGIGFDGTGDYLKGGRNGDDRALANELAGILDDYNNNCTYDD